MLDDLDKSIATLLKQELPADVAAQVQVTFARPDASFPPSGVTPPAIDLFLYDVRENAELRRLDWIVERTDGSATRRPPPVRIDCSYLITAWPNETSPTAAADEHRLLGAVIAVLLKHATLPQAVLQGSLGDQELPPPTATLQGGRLSSVGEFWQAIGRPKPVVNYLVTIAFAPSAPEDVGPLVQEPVVQLEQRTRSS